MNTVAEQAAEIIKANTYDQLDELGIGGVVAALADAGLLVTDDLTLLRRAAIRWHFGEPGGTNDLHEAVVAYLASKGEQ